MSVVGRDGIVPGSKQYFENIAKRVGSIASSVDVTQLVMEKYHITEKQKEIKQLHKEIGELQAGLERKCTHPTVTTKRDYTPGSYYDRSYTTVIKTCTICDKVLGSYDDPNYTGSYG